MRWFLFIFRLAATHVFCLSTNRTLKAFLTEMLAGSNRTTSAVKDIQKIWKLGPHFFKMFLKNFERLSRIYGWVPFSKTRVGLFWQTFFRTWTHGCTWDSCLHITKPIIFVPWSYHRHHLWKWKWARNYKTSKRACPSFTLSSKKLEKSSMAETLRF